jgi:3-hydroxyisobutyrate dehydrogenase-like beta-hydroxyacid dehydrogenase
MAAAERIGLIGLGSMGGALAERLLTRGAQLIVCDRDAEKVGPFKARGVPVAATPRDIADEAEIVLTSLPSTAASLDVGLGENGIAHGKSVAVYVETSTIGKRTAELLAEGLPKRIGFVDSPVSGGPPGALAGTLTTICAASREHFERALPALSLMAKNVFYVGQRPGMAQVAKLINNHLSTAGRLAAFEGLVMALKAGLDTRVLIDVINVSSGRNYTTTDKIPAAIFTGTFTFNGQLTISLKDEALLLEEAEKLGVPLWLAPRLFETLQEAADAGYRDSDSMYVIQHMGERAGIDVKALMAKGGSPNSGRREKPARNNRVSRLGPPQHGRGRAE